MAIAGHGGDVDEPDTVGSIGLTSHGLQQMSGPFEVDGASGFRMMIRIGRDHGRGMKDEVDALHGALDIFGIRQVPPDDIQPARILFVEVGRKEFLVGFRGAQKQAGAIAIFAPAQFKKGFVDCIVLSLFFFELLSLEFLIHI